MSPFSSPTTHSRGDGKVSQTVWTFLGNVVQPTLGGVIGDSSDTMSAPLPPAELAAYILGYEHTTGVLDAYLEQGEQIAAAIERLLGPEWSWQGKRVLDFGCGAARVLRQFLGRAGEAELHGVELDESCVAWIEANLSPPLRVIPGAELPPLPYPDASFDLIWSTSVFSHLADSWSAWLLELHRLLKPSGVAVVSVMGAASSQPIAYEEWDPDRIGMTVLGYGRPWRAGGPMILHSEWWIRAHWGRAFTIAAFEDGGIAGQDAVVLLRDTRPAPSVAQLDAPQPDEPRELAAAHHAIELLHREHATLNRQHDEYAQAYIDEAQPHGGGCTHHGTRKGAATAGSGGWWARPAHDGQPAPARPCEVDAELDLRTVALASEQLVA